MSEPKPKAFPSWELNKQDQPEMTEQGMELRDWFAGQAIAGLSADHDYPVFKDGAADAYRIADAMMEARNK